MSYVWTTLGKLSPKIGDNVLFKGANGVHEKYLIIDRNGYLIATPNCDRAKGEQMVLASYADKWCLDVPKKTLQEMIDEVL